MAPKREKKEKEQVHSIIEEDIRFIVPMPGKSSWHTPKSTLTFKKLHKFNNLAGDLGLEDYQAQFLMQREYLID